MLMPPCATRCCTCLVSSIVFLCAGPAGVFSPSQIRDRVAASLAVLDLPAPILRAFTADVQSRPDRDTICATTGSMIQYYAVWKHANAVEAGGARCAVLPDLPLFRSPCAVVESAL